MKDLIKTLEDLPNGVFIGEDGSVYEVENGEVTKYVKESSPSQELGTINDPK